MTLNKKQLEVSAKNPGTNNMSAQALAVESSVAQVALLHRISSIVSSNQELESMLQELVGLIVQVTSCDACLVYLADHVRGEVVLRASQLPHDAEIGNLRLKMGEGVTGWVAVHQSLVALPDHASRDTALQSLPDLAGRYLRGILIGSAGFFRRTDWRH